MGVTYPTSPAAVSAPTPSRRRFILHHTAPPYYIISAHPAPCGLPLSPLRSCRSLCSYCAARPSLPVSRGRSHPILSFASELVVHSHPISSFPSFGASAGVCGHTPILPYYSGVVWANERSSITGPAGVGTQRNNPPAAGRGVAGVTRLRVGWGKGVGPKPHPEAIVTTPAEPCRRRPGRGRRATAGAGAPCRPAGAAPAAPAFARSPGRPLPPPAP